jgi:hypothetical protein
MKFNNEKKNFLLTKNNNKSIHRIIIFITFAILINFSKCYYDSDIYKDKDNNYDDLVIGNLTIRDGNYLADNFKIISTNKNNLRINKKNKLCMINNLEDFNNRCKPFVNIFYNKWVKKNKNKKNII